MKIIVKTHIFPLIIMTIFTLSFSFVYAESTGPGGGSTGSGGSVTTGEKVSFDNPLGNGVTFENVVTSVIKGILGIVGVAALVIFLYGGIMWMTSLGNAERVKRGRDTLIWGTLGLIVVFASFAVVNLILSALDSA